MGESKKGYQIEIKNVSKSFGNLEILQDINITIEPGDFVAIVGQSGCGKSTLIRMISGLDSPTSGGIFLDGKEVTGINSKVRFLFKEPRLLPWKNIIQNIILGTSGRNEATAAQFLEKVGLINGKYAWPNKLSGGQQQRVSLARALAGEPDILLLDEPLAALDALTRGDILELIEKLWLEKGFTAILVTRDVSEAVRLANRVILLEEKKITMDLKITLPRPRLKDNDTTHFEQSVLSRLVRRDNKNEEFETHMIEYII